MVGEAETNPSPSWRDPLGEGESGHWLLQDAYDKFRALIQQLIHYGPTKGQILGHLEAIADELKLKRDYHEQGGIPSRC